MNDRIASLSQDHLSEVLTALSALRHDLGKYVAFQSRHLPKEAPLAALREALADDLLATRRSPEGRVDALQLWATLSAPLRGDLSGDGDFDRLEAAMTEIGEAIASLRSETLPDGALAATAARASEVASLCATLWRRARERAAALVDPRDG